MADRVTPQPQTNRPEEYLTINASPAQARRLVDLGVLTEQQARQAEEAGALLVRVPAHLVEEYRREQEKPAEAELENIARWINSTGLNATARFFLSANRPLSFFGSQVLLAAQPFTRLVAGKADPSARWSRLLEDRANLDHLVNRLEELQTGEGRKRVRS